MLEWPVTQYCGAGYAGSQATPGRGMCLPLRLLAAVALASFFWPQSTNGSILIEKAEREVGLHIVVGMTAGARPSRLDQADMT